MNNSLIKLFLVQASSIKCTVPVLQAFAPLGNGKELLGDPELLAIAKEHNKTPAQVQQSFPGSDRDIRSALNTAVNVGKV